MKNNIFMRGLIVLSLFACLSSCQDEEYGYTTDQIKVAKYDRIFEQTFGKIDENQDFSMASLVKADINLSQIKGTSKLNIMTGDPRFATTRLLGQVMLQNGVGSVSFDAIKGNEKVFVTVEQNNKYQVFREYTIENGMLHIDDEEHAATRSAMNSSATTRAFSQTPATTAEAPVETCMDIWDMGIKNPKSNDVHSLEDWFKIEKATVGQWNPAQFFKDESVRHFVLVGEIDWAHCTYELKPDAIVNGNGTITHNNQTMSVDAWKNAISNDGNSKYGIPAGWYSYGPWKNDSYVFQETDCTPTQNGAVFKGIFPEDHWVLPDGWTYKHYNTNKKLKVQYLNGVETSPAEPWLRGVGQKLYGSEGFFCEQNYYWGPKETTYDKTILYGNTEQEKIATMQGIEAGFSITATGGPIELPLIYASTGNLDQFGYVLYDEGQDPLSQPHYVLIDNATPNHNIYYQGHRNGGSWVDEPVRFSGTEAYYQFMKNYENGSMKDKDSSPEEMAIYLKEFNTPVYGTTYRLVEFDSNGNASYNITAGKKVVFFLMKVNTLDHTASINANTFYYSLPELNYRVNNLYGGENHNSLTYKAGLAPEGAVKATSWFADGHYYLGFEDGGGDEDLNDIIFWAEGGRTRTSIELFPIKWHMNTDPSGDGHLTDDSDLYWVDAFQAGMTYKQPDVNPTYGDVTFLGWATTPLGDPIPGSDKPGFIEGQTPLGGICYFARWNNEIKPVPDPDPMGWIFACEDLGGTFDYDFNDIVWEVQRKDETHLKVKILAAGGTMDFALMFGHTTVCTKENAFTSPVTYDQIINAGADHDGYTPAVNTVVCSSTWSIAQNKGDFTVLMNPKDGNSWFITNYSKDNDDAKYGKAPQIFVVASRYWEWPIEKCPIHEAYTDFSSWVRNAEITSFWSDKIKSNVYSKHLSEDPKYVNIFVNEQSLINSAGIEIKKSQNGQYYEIFDPNMITETKTLCIEVQQGFTLFNNFEILDMNGNIISHTANIISFGGNQVVEIQITDSNKNQTFKLAFKNKGLHGQIKINRIYFKKS